MKRLISRKVYNKNFNLAENERFEHQRYEIAKLLIDSPQFFLRTQDQNDIGQIERVELFVLEPNDLKDYYFLLTHRKEWEQFKKEIEKRTISFSWDIKGYDTREDI